MELAINIINKLLFLLSVIFLPFQAHCQNSMSEEQPRTMAELTTRGIATGIHLNKYPMLELGYYQHTIFEYPMTIGGSYTIESYFLDKVVFAPKVNYWLNISFINAGFSFPWYLDFEGNNSLKVRPELGFGYNNFKINYAMNISLTHKNMGYIGKHFISLNYYIRLKEKNKD